MAKDTVRASNLLCLLALGAGLSLGGPVAASPATAERVTVPPVPVTTVPLRYPESERSDARNVFVELYVDVSATGEVTGASVSQSGGAAFDKIALETIKQWHFEPAQRRGENVAVQIVGPVHFHAPHQAHRHEDHAPHAHEPGAHTAHPAHHEGEAPHHHAPSGEMPPGNDRGEIVPPAAPHAHAEVKAPATEHDASTTVQAKATTMSASEVRLDRRALLDTNRKSAEDLVRRVPGVHVVQHGTEGKAPQFYVRGFDALHGSDIEVRLGRIPLNEPSHVHGHGYIDLAMVIPELVEGIDVKPGAFDLQQGPFSTAASLRFRPGAAGPGVTVGVEGGWPLRGRAYTVLALSKRRYIGVEGVSTRGFGQGRDAQRANVNAAWSQPLLPGLQLDAGVLASATRFSLPGAVRLDDVQSGRVGVHDSYAPGSGGGVRVLAHVGANSRFQLGPTTAIVAAQSYLGAKRLQLNENYTGFLKDAAWGDEVRQAQSHLDGGAVVDAQWRIHRAFALSMVGEARHVVGQQGVALGAQQEVPQAGFASTHIGAGVGAKTRILSFALMTLSLRADGFRLGNDDSAAWGAALSPRARVVIRPGIPGLELFGAAGRGLRGPDAVGFTSAAKDKAPLSVDMLRLTTGSIATAEGGEVGASFSWRGLQATALVFGTFNADELRFDHVARTTTSAGASRRLGAQGRLAYDLGEWLTLSGDVTATDARFVDPDTLLSTEMIVGGEHVAGVPPLMAAMRLALSPFSGLRVGGNVQLLSARPLRFGASTAPIAVANAFARYTWRSITLHAAMDNVLDARYAEGAGMFASRWDTARPQSQIPVQHLYAGSPRVVRVGAEMRF